MANRIPKVARRLTAATLLVCVAVLSHAQSQAPDEGTSSSVKRKKPTQTTHHTTVAEEVVPPPELAQAEDLIAKHDYARAEPLLQKVLAGDAGNDLSNYVAWFELGFVENGLGKTDASIAAYRKSVAAKPDVFEPNLNLGLQLARTNSPEAEQFLVAATQLKPASHAAEGQARAWLSLAHVLEKTKPDEAVAAYKESAVLQPKDPEPHLAAGQFLEKQGKTADAEQEYKQALALDPASDAVTGLANLYMRTKRLPEAEVELRKLVASHPEQADARIQLGRVLAADNKFDEAISELQAGAKLAPTDPSLQHDLADLCMTARKFDQAEPVYRTLLAATPTDAPLHQALGRSLLEQKKYLAAQNEFQDALKIDPKLATAYADLAFAASENKNYPLTIRVLDVRVKYLPEEAITYFLRASAYDHLLDVKKASANYHLFLKAANGKYPDQEWQAKHRLIALEPKK